MVSNQRLAPMLKVAFPAHTLFQDLQRNSRRMTDLRLARASP